MVRRFLRLQLATLLGGVVGWSIAGGGVASLAQTLAECVFSVWMLQPPSANPGLWVMGVHLRGSLLLLLFSQMLDRVRRPAAAWGTALLVTLGFSWTAAGPTAVMYALLLLGAILAHVHLASPLQPISAQQLRQGLLPCTLLLVASLLLWHDALSPLTPPALLAAVLFALPVVFPAVQSCLDIRAGAFLGKITCTLCALHAPLIAVVATSLHAYLTHKRHMNQHTVENRSSR
jgi:hypothetical protein